MRATSRSLTGLGTALATSLLALFAFAVLATSAQAAPDVEPILRSGNPTCEGLGYDHGFRVDPPNSGTYTVYDDEEVTLTTNDGVYFDWSSTFGIDAVIAKGGPNANAYVYDPPAESTGDDGLHSPENASGQPAGLSHVDFCYDFNVDVSKTANATFDRTYNWKIEKSNESGSTEEEPLPISEGQQLPIDYTVTVGLDDPPFADSNYAVDGTITINNNTPLAASINSISDVLNDGTDASASVSCQVDGSDVTIPFNLPAGKVANCTYEASGLDGDENKNTVDVDASNSENANAGDSAEADIDWPENPTDEFDTCVDVYDDKGDPVNNAPPGDVFLETVCLEDLTGDPPSKKIEYTQNVGPFEDPDCGPQTVTNTARFVTDDNGATGNASSDVYLNVRCESNGGCTLTQGYWKTHSDRGPAPYDDAWKNVGPLEEDTVFFLSGKTWYEVFRTPPAGNPYYILAHQYMAAKLNILNGASSTTAVDAAITAAETFFTTKTPTSSLTNAQKNQVRALAATLDQYNNGLIGPGHCAE